MQSTNRYRKAVFRPSSSHRSREYQRRSIMKITDNGKHGPLIRNFLKRRTMFNDKIQIRVAIDLNFVADKVQPLGSIKWTIRRWIVTGKFVTLRRSFPSKLFPTARTNEMNRGLPVQVIVRDSFNLLRDSLRRKRRAAACFRRTISKKRNFLWRTLPVFGKNYKRYLNTTRGFPVALFLAVPVDERPLTPS